MRRLGIDFGTTHTVAAVEDVDGAVRPLLFDASPLLLSAVYAESGGVLLTGRDAERSALHDPGRYEPNPKLRIDDGRILLGGAEIDVEDVIAAPLRRVHAEAGRHLGTPPTDVVLTCPASWAAQRREVLFRAAERAGLGRVHLVPEPVAAASFHAGLAERSTSSVREGSRLVVFDLGGGTFDVSVVRRAVTGWDVVATGGLGDVGGIDLDAAIVEHLGRTVGAREPRRWRRLLGPTDDPGRRALRAFNDDVRGAKEQLSRAPSAVIRVPGFDVEAYVSREEFEAVALPWLNRTVDLVADVLGGAGMRRNGPDALVLVGGSSRIPLVATLLHRRFGVAPVLVDQPELVVALGSLRVPVPTALIEAPSDAWPVEGTPITPGPPPPGPQPRQQRPRRPPRPRHLQPEPRQSPPRQPVAARWGRTAAATAVLLLVVALVAWYSNRDARQGGNVTGKQQVDVGKSVWYGGFELRFGRATYDPGAGNALTVKTTVRNLGREDRGPGAVPVSVSFGGRSYDGRFSPDDQEVVAGSAVDFELRFTPLDPVPNLKGATLTLGDNDVLKAKVRLDGGELVALEPKPLFRGGAQSVRSLYFTNVACTTYGFDPVFGRQVRDGNVAIGCSFDAEYKGESFDRPITGDVFRLVLPDGNLRAPVNVAGASVPKDGAERNLGVVFVVPAPLAAGRYALRLNAINRFNEDEHVNADIPFTVQAG